MQRREFITLLGGAAAAPSMLLPLAARAQTIPTVGFIDGGSLEPRRFLIATFQRGLKEAGYVEGQNVAIEYRFADGLYDRLPQFATDLVRLPVTVIAATGGDPSALAAKAATTTIPIVFAIGNDPVQLGLVASLNRPGGNITGITQLTGAVLSKRLELLHEMVPTATVIGVIVNPNRAGIDAQLKELQASARSLGRRIHILNVKEASEFAAAFDTFRQNGVGALLFAPDVLFTSRSHELIALATRHAIPAIYYDRLFAEAGGLVSYGSGLADSYHQAGLYVGRILKGAKPADLPVIQAAKIELVINLRTAKQLGLTFPLSLIGRADEVIE